VVGLVVGLVVAAVPPLAAGLVLVLVPLQHLLAEHL
jgi:hypothetical protein